MKRSLSAPNIKTILKKYLDPNFWKTCRVQKSPGHHRFVFSHLAHHIQKLSEPKQIYNLLNGIPELKPFVPEVKSIHHLNILKQTVIRLLYLFTPSHPVALIEIVGCSEVDWFKIQNQPQYIYVVGENHDYTGNILSILKNFSSNFRCPIHVVVEKSYDSFWDLNLADYYKANSTSFYKPPLKTCTIKGAIPKAQNLFDPENKKYLKNCVEPYRGRVKIWAIDIRRTSIFYLIYIPWNTCVYTLGERVVLDYIKTKPAWKKWFEKTKEILLCIYDFPLARNDLFQYDQNIMKALHTLYSCMPHDVPEHLKYDKQDLSDLILDIMLTKDKSHIDFVKSILHFPPDVVEKWREIAIKDMEINDFRVLFCIGLHDLYAMIRLARILKKQKEGILLFFAGFLHTRNICNYIRHSPFLHAEHIIQLKEKTSRHKVLLPVPILECHETTQMMQAYQKSEVIVKWNNK